MRGGELSSRMIDKGGISKKHRNEISPGRFFLMPSQAEAAVERMHRNQSDLYDIEIYVHLLCDGEDATALWRINIR